MQHRKIKGKKGKYPTHIVGLCTNCKRGVMVKKFDERNQTYYRVCQNCRNVQYDSTTIFAPIFTTGNKLK